METTQIKTKHIKSHKCGFDLRSLRLSLRFRPEIMKLILKMRHKMRKKCQLLHTIKKQLKEQIKSDKTCVSTQSETDPQTDKENIAKVTESNFQNAFIQTDEEKKETEQNNLSETVAKAKSKGVENCERNSNMEYTQGANVASDKNSWNFSGKNRKTEKRIVEQVAEVAQNAMVYVESAKMYYDHKTGYYYSADLGLYYHPYTGCYYRYSKDKKTFEFYSYPDQRKTATNALYEAYEKRKVRKCRKEKEEDSEHGSKPKRKKKSSKKKIDNGEDIKESKTDSDAVEIANEQEKLLVDEKGDENKVSRDLEDGECSESEEVIEELATFRGNNEEIEDAMKLNLKKKVERYMKKAESIKKLVRQQKEFGKFHEQVLIEDNSTGHSYKSLFGRFLDDDVQFVVVEDPYIRSFYQCQNLLRLCELLVKYCCNLKQIQLLTSKDPKSEGDQRNRLDNLMKDLQKYQVNLTVEYSETLHDRQITLSTGWIIKMGRGLDFFKPPVNRFCLGMYDMDLRPCYETTVDIVHSKNVKQSYG